MEVSPPPFTLAVFDEEKMMADVDLNKLEDVYHLNPDYMNPLCLPKTANVPPPPERLWGQFEPNLSFGNLDLILEGLCRGDRYITPSFFMSRMEPVKMSYKEQKTNLDAAYKTEHNLLNFNFGVLRNFFYENIEKFKNYSGIDVGPALAYTLGELNYKFEDQINWLIYKLDIGKTPRIERAIRWNHSDHMNHWRSLKRIKSDETNIIQLSCYLQWIELEKEAIRKAYEPPMRALQKIVAKDKWVCKACNFFYIDITTPTVNIGTRGMSINRK